jgi:4-amino-4-deoxy-L-arabinose transferase-like glycosyltransferase
MEARNFITAREMLQDNNWLLTTINNEPRYQKPPLPTWLSAISASIFGIKSVFGMRFPAALISMVLVLVSYRLAHTYTKHKTYALLSSLTLASSFFVVLSGRNGQWDIFTHAFMMLSIYQLYLLFTEETKKYQHALIAAVFVGCSFMSKGPVSLYALLLPFLISYGCTFRFKNMKTNILPLMLFVVLGFMLSGWWYYYVYLFDTQNILNTTSKETVNWSSYNIRPFYYYWSFFTQSGAWALVGFIGLLYPYLKNKVVHKKAYSFTFLWTITSVILLSIIPEKKSRYLLPVLIPLALNTGFYIEYLFRKFKTISDKKETIPVYFNFAIIGLGGILFPVFGYFFLKNTPEVSWGWFIALALSLFLIGIFICLKLIQKQIQPVFYATILFLASLVCFGMPLSTITFQNTAYKSFTVLKQWEAQTKIPVYEFAYFTPEIIWEYGSNIPVIFNQNQTTTLPEEETFAVLVGVDDESSLQEAFKNYSIQKVSRYDINIHDPSHKNYNGRLWRDLFLVSSPKIDAVPID